MAGNKRLTVGLVLDTSLDTAEGVPQYVIQIGEWLRDAGHEVHYLVGETKRQDLPNIHSLARNIAVRFNGSRTTIPLPTSKHKIKNFMIKHDFDVLHVQTPHHPLLAQRIVLAASPRTAVVGTFHILPYNFLSKLGNRLLGVWLKPSLKRFDKMLAVTPAAASFCLSSFKLESQILPNLVDFDRFHRAQPLPDYADGRLTVLYLGSLVKRKGAPVLLQSIKLLKQKPGLPAFRVVICGKGPLEAKLKQYAADNQLNDTVVFAGFVSEEDKPRYYASADLAVFPSISGESFGIVLLEAMAAGHAAVLAGNNPGYSSVMHEQPELLFNPKNSGQLAEKLAQFLQDTSLRQKMASWGNEYTRQFDIEVVGPQLLAIYKEALHKRRQL